MSDKTIEQLCSELHSAKESYRAAEKAASFARNEATDCLNRLNEAQRALGARMETLAKDAPADSDWGKKKREAIARSIP